MNVRRAALVTGIGYLLNPVTFAQGYAMPKLVADDPAQTTANMTAHPKLLAAVVVSYFVSALGDIVIAWALYYLLAPVNRALAALGSLFQLVYAAVWISAIANLGVIYRLVAIPDYAKYVDPAQLPFRVQELLASYRAGWLFGLVMFGLHLVVTGWLFTRSTYLPRWIGWLLMVDGVAWVFDSLSPYLYPTANVAFLNAFFAAELVFIVWLWGWGWRVRDPNPQAS